MSNENSHPGTAGSRIAVAVARFNGGITDLLSRGCVDALKAAGMDESDIDLVDVPGAWELPLASRLLVDSGRYDAVVALGAVIRGETAHFDFISSECARGLQQVSLDSGIPVAFGVLTPENGEQALQRADPERKNKGREAAMAALDMIALARSLAS